MIDKDVFLKNLKRILSNPFFYSYIYDDAKKIINEYCFFHFKGRQQPCDNLWDVFEIKQRPVISLKLTKEQIEFEKEQVKNLDEIKFKNLKNELSKIPCERRIYNRGHYFEDDEDGSFCSFCRMHPYGIKNNHDEKRKEICEQS